MGESRRTRHGLVVASHAPGGARTGKCIHSALQQEGGIWGCGAVTLTPLHNVLSGRMEASHATRGIARDVLLHLEPPSSQLWFLSFKFLDMKPLYGWTPLLALALPLLASARFVVISQSLSSFPVRYVLTLPVRSSITLPPALLWLCFRFPFAVSPSH